MDDLKKPDPKSEQLIKFKVLLVGDSTVGKSSIIRRYIDNEFEFVMSRTVGKHLNSAKARHHTPIVHTPCHLPGH